MYLNSEEKYTLSVGLQLFIGTYKAEWNLMMAAACVVVMPCIIVFLIGQRYLSRELPCPASKVRRRSFVIGKDYIDWTQSALSKAAVVIGDHLPFFRADPVYDPNGICRGWRV